MSANGANFITYLNAIMNSATHSVLEDMTNKDFFPDGENPTVVFAAALRASMDGTVDDAMESSFMSDRLRVGSVASTSFKAMHIGSFRQSIILSILLLYASYSCVRSGLSVLEQMDSLDQIINAVREDHSELADVEFDNVDDLACVICHDIAVTTFKNVSIEE